MPIELPTAKKIQKLEKRIQEYNIRIEKIALYFDLQLYKEQ